MRVQKVLLEIIIAMGRTGIVGYGGGPSIIPLIRHEAVTRYRWINNEEFSEILALANTLPGPIATKMAAYLGYRKAKTFGAILAVIAHIAPSVFLMLFLFSALSRLNHSPVVRDMITSVDPVVVVLLGLMVYDFGDRTVKGLGIWAGSVLCLVLFCAITFFELPVAIVVAACLVYGTVHFPVVRFVRTKIIKSDKDKGASR